MKKYRVTVDITIEAKDAKTALQYADQLVYVGHDIADDDEESYVYNWEVTGQEEVDD